MHLIRVFIERILPPKYLLIGYFVLSLLLVIFGGYLPVEILKAVSFFLLVSFIVHVITFIFLAVLMVAAGNLKHSTDEINGKSKGERQRDNASRSDSWQRFTWFAITAYSVVMLTGSITLAYFLWSTGQASEADCVAQLMASWAFFELLARDRALKNAEWVFRNLVFFAIFAFVALGVWGLSVAFKLPSHVCLGFAALVYYAFRIWWIRYNEKTEVVSVFTGENNQQN